MKKMLVLALGVFLMNCEKETEYCFNCLKLQRTEWKLEYTCGKVDTISKVDTTRFYPCHVTKDEMDRMIAEAHINRCGFDIWWECSLNQK